MGSNNENTRSFTPARIVALVLIAAAAAGLGYLRLAPDATLTVPDGARAGQIVDRHACDLPTDDGDLRAECSTLVVRENRADPGSRRIALPVTRIHAREPRAGAAPVFRLEGGPGVTNMEFAQAARFAEHRDVVLVGYRGVDGSSELGCPEVTDALKGSSDFLSARSMDAYEDGFADCATRLRDEGFDLGGYTLAQRVDDFEDARRALGYDRIDLLSESAGTRTALIYAWRHPASIRRSVMIGANPPGHFLWHGEHSDALIERYSRLCERDEHCRRQTPDLAASMRRTADDIPDRWEFLPIRAGNVRLASFYGLMESEEDGPLNAPATFDAWLAAANGDASGFWFQSLMADLALPANVWGDIAAASRQDVAAAERHFASERDRDRGSILGNPATRFMWGDGRLTDGWPAAPGEDEYSRMRDTDVETLVVSGNLDGTTPVEVAKREVMPHLRNGRHVVLSDLAHTVDFWAHQPEASTDMIETYLDSGRVDDSRYEHRTVDFTPAGTHTTIAKAVGGTMVGMPAIALLSLLLMALRVRRGGFGRRASAVLRSLFPAVLGLGGWLGAVLVMVAAFPTVPLDSVPVAVGSIGLPVALGIHLAWRRRGGPRGGLAAATAGALAGAWLGYQAGSDLLAVLTTIAGATLGANLALIWLDVRSARAGRRRAAAPAAAPVHSTPGVTAGAPS